MTETQQSVKLAPIKSAKSKKVKEPSEKQIREDKLDKSGSTIASFTEGGPYTYGRLFLSEAKILTKAVEGYFTDDGWKSTHAIYEEIKDKLPGLSRPRVFRELKGLIRQKLGVGWDEYLPSKDERLKRLGLVIEAKKEERKKKVSSK